MLVIAVVYSEDASSADYLNFFQVPEVLFVPGFADLEGDLSVFLITFKALVQTRDNLNLWVSFISTGMVIDNYMPFIII